MRRLVDVEAELVESELESNVFDGMAMIGVPHAGGWKRLPDGRSVCGAHNLAPDEH